MSKHDETIIGDIANNLIEENKELRQQLAEAEKVIYRAKDMIQGNHYFSGLGELEAYREKTEGK